MINNMEYKLAEKLKDAGYPQDYNPKYDTGGGGGAPGSDIRMPRLEELIEACLVLEKKIGFQLVTLRWTNKQPLWLATAILKQNKINTEGKTPKTAVANLYLKLNEHKSQV